MDVKSPTIPQWFRDRNVFMTGATGFMGKVLISKLLTSCPDIGKVYILVREKRGVDPQTRLQSLIQNEPFRQLREEHPEYLKKLIALPGDITMEDLGLSSLHKDLLVREISVVFHGAANVKFDVPLKDALTMNTRGTANLLNLAKQMKKLESLIHVSTAYTHCDEEILEEKAYPSPMSPEDMMALIKIVDDEMLESMTPKLLRNFPNTYAFTKALSEDLVNRSNLPVGVARPSIVLASWKEPAAGWIESLNGPTGMMIGAAKGVIRSVLCDADLVIDAIPCDIAINAIIALAWKVGLEQPIKPIYINVTESGENPLTWGEALGYGRKHALANPFSGILWYPRGGITKNKYLHTIAVLFLHLLPAYFIDAILLVTGNKPFMIRIQAKVSWGMKLVQYYTMKPWIFRNDAMKDLRKQLLPADKEVFFMDMKSLNWDEYMKIYVLGARKYVLNEDPSTLPQTRKIFMIYWIVDIICMFSVGFSLLWIIGNMLLPLSFTKTLIEVVEH